MQNKLLKWAHDHPMGGHAGQQKTLFRLSTRVYWASMRKDIFNYVAACEDCQKFKYINIPTATPMQLHEVREPWHTMGIDIMGPFPVTARQRRFLLVIVDYFTRWIEIFPMRTITSTDIVEVLINQVFARYGLPRYILSDNGPQFVSNLFSEFCRSLKIRQKFTANYHPQTNMTERVNRTLKPLIAIFAQEHPHSWDKEIQQLAFAIRTSVNETTGETPAFLMFGRDPIIPLDLIIGEPIQGPPLMNKDQEQTRNYRTYLMNKLRVAFNTVKEHSEVEKLTQKMKYDKHTTQREFAEGDLVWVATTTAQLGNNSIRGKLQPKYQGPCRIMERRGPSTFIIKRISDNVNLGATNADRLKLYYKPIPDSIDSQMDSMVHSDQPPTQNHSRATTSPQTMSTLNNQIARRPPSNRQRRAPVRFQP
jgi:Integrase zinc binding domain/Integrase core domain